MPLNAVKDRNERDQGVSFEHTTLSSEIREKVEKQPDILDTIGGEKREGTLFCASSNAESRARKLLSCFGAELTLKIRATSSSMVPVNSGPRAPPLPIELQSIGLWNYKVKAERRVRRR